MTQEVQAAFAEMLDISTDIDKAVLIGPDGVLASNMGDEAQDAAVVQAGSSPAWLRRGPRRWAHSLSLSW